MRTCWANSLGGCSTKLTKEHSVTRSLFGSEEIFVQGFPWCLDKPKKVGISSAAKRHLCKTHNAQLSETDAAAIGILRAFEKVAHPGKADGVFEDVEINADNFERWALKTLINIGTESGYPIGKNSNQPNVPSPLLVRLAFGARRFDWRTGIYIVGEPKGTFEYANRYTFSPLISPTGYIHGTLLIFCGFKFALLLEDPGTSLQTLNVVGGNRVFAPGPLYVAHHPKDLRIEVDGRRLTLNLNW
jgi:hypothetical protein